MKKDIKIIAPFVWMAFIFYLSGKSADFFAGVQTDERSISAHFLLYTVLAMLFVAALSAWRPGWGMPRIYLAAFLLSVLYGMGDEVHQSFVPSRSASIGDCLTDAVGAAAGIAVFFWRRERQPRLLLHICCIGCGVSILEKLKDAYDITLFFANPNIFPASEYGRRLDEIKKVAGAFDFKIVINDDDHGAWLKKVRGRELDRERGERCEICYRERLEETARCAKKNHFEYFATTLTISPHKNTEAILRIGRELAEESGVGFLSEDFKKNDGFKQSVRRSKELGLYRQNYCGCEFSLRQDACECGSAGKKQELQNIPA